MKTMRMVVVLAAMAVISILRAAEPQSLTVAIFDFESRDEAVRDLGPRVAALLQATLSNEPQLLLVELEKVLSEQELGLAGVGGADTVARVGHLTGAKVLVTGRVFKAEKEIFLVAKVTGAETSRVFGELVKGAPTASLADLSAELAKRIAATIRQKSDVLLAKPETQEELVARIRKSLRGRNLPSVSIRLTERHYGGPAIDPAAETELGKIMQAVGFRLSDDKSPEQAEVEITGEAFSAYGMRKGNLISCKARVELKARKRTGELLAVDRQTSVAVDVAEQTAGKTALQNAAAELAARVLPKLAP
jgi:hypothetical protein